MQDLTLATSKSPTKKIYIGIYEEDNLLCPYSTLQCLLTQTQIWKNEPKKQKALFLISRPPYIPAATDTIYLFIYELDKEHVRSTNSEKEKEM